MSDTYRFYLPIGDWSDDGHGMVINYLVESNQPIEQVRDTHFLIKGVTGIDIEDICSEYEEDEINEEVKAELEALGFEFTNEFGDENIMSAEEMVRLWMFLLMKTDPSLQLKRVKDYPMLPFYGFDDKGRHIGGVGYGVLS